MNSATREKIREALKLRSIGTIRELERISLDDIPRKIREDEFSYCTDVDTLYRTRSPRKRSYCAAADYIRYPSITIFGREYLVGVASTSMFSADFLLVENFGDNREFVFSGTT